MKTLIAEDESVSRRLLQVSLTKWGYNVTLANDGNEAWSILQSPTPPTLLILDWLMPGIDGIDICRSLREVESENPPYIILLTAKNDKSDIVHGLEAGADDYITKPFDSGELRARVHVGARIINLQNKLARHVCDLTQALSHVRQLHGLLPICGYCKKIRDDQNYWHRVETYIANHTDVRFSHGVCPDCTARIKAEMQRDPDFS